MYVRLTAVSRLLDIRDKGQIAALAKALEDETPEVSCAAAQRTPANDQKGKKKGQ